MNGWQQFYAILRKDLLMELRSKDIISSMLVFSLIVVVIFNFIFDPGSGQMKTMTPGILWVAIIFAGNIGLARSFAREQEQGMMHGLLLCPVDRTIIYLAKVTGNIIFILLVQLVTLPVMIILFDLEPGVVFGPVLLVLFLGIFGFASVGTIFSTMSANTKSKEVMLPILLFPIIVPILLAATKSTASLLNGNGLADTMSWIKLLIGFDLIFFVVCFLLYEYVLEE